MNRIVVGVDGSDGARRALAWAVDEAATWAAPLAAVHVWAVPVMAAPSGMAPLAMVPDTTELERAAEDFLAQAVAEALAGRKDVDVERVVVEGPAAEALLHAAAQADLLVVGSRGHG